MASALHKWMAQHGSHDKIHEEETDDVGGEMADMHDGGEDHEGELKRQFKGTKPFDISEEHASLLGLGDDRALERGERHTGNMSPMEHDEESGMTQEHKSILGMDDEDE